MQPLGENSTNIPAFLGKLWKMVNDPSTDRLICWSPSGTSFTIQNQAQFWYELLPLYYKHNNMSSFVRQLNMYGFHKLSSVENGTMDADRDEIQFSHNFFIKDQPDLLRNIKRKATTAKNLNESSSQKHDELSKILSDVKQLRGRQVTVDSKISAMRKENALLWREVALLRQKHIKQQKIVNKLIQFLVTLVQPTRMTVGVKRGYQLMLNESPTKSRKTNINKSNTVQEGPTIHELDSELDLPSTIYDDDEAVVSSPTSVNSQQVDLNSPLQTQWLNEESHDDPTCYEKPAFDLRTDSPEYIPINDLDSVDTNLIDSLDRESSSIKSRIPNSTKDNEKFFLNPSGQDALLSNLMNTNSMKTKCKNDSSIASTSEKSLPSAVNNNMTIATVNKNLRDASKSVPSTSDSYNNGLTNHVEATQTELDQLKDILNGYNSFVDANSLWGELSKISQNSPTSYLFDEDSPAYDLNVEEGKNDDLNESADPMVSGSELAPYGTNFDFTELLDESLDSDAYKDIIPTTEPASTINTPLITKDELIFPKQHRK